MYYSCFYKLLLHSLSLPLFFYLHLIVLKHNEKLLIHTIFYVKIITPQTYLTYKRFHQSTFLLYGINPPTLGDTKKYF